jgi:hypothetical protein
MRPKISAIVLAVGICLLPVLGGYNPVVAAVDTDFDGVTDLKDNCKNVPNGPTIGTCLAGGCDGEVCFDAEECCGGFCSMNQEDGDGDGQGDVCDSDIDGDGITNSSDNCPFHANGPVLGTCISGRVGFNCTSSFDCLFSMLPGVCSQDQEDMDSDGMGDVCDSSYNYVIVTTNQIRNFSKALDGFVAHKNSRGFSVRIVTETDFNLVSGPYPNRRAEKIRQWLVNNYQAMGIEYVMLIGNPDPDDPMYDSDIGDEINDPTYMNDDYIPMKQVWHNLPGGLTHWGDATDWYYADLTGNWDADGDGFYGETPWLRQSEVIFSDLHGLSLAGFSVRWTIDMMVNTKADYNFILKQWQGARLKVDGAVVLDHWPQTRRESERQAVVTLQDGHHEVVVEYFQKTGHGHIRAFVDSPETGLQALKGRGEYFNNPDLKDPPVHVASDDAIDKIWETTDFSESTTINAFGLVGGVDLNAEVSVGRIPVYDNDYATLDRILRRIIDYEITAYHPSRRRILLPMKTTRDDLNAELDMNYTLGEAISQQIAEPRGYSTFRIYDRDDYSGLIRPPESTPCNQENVREAWNIREIGQPGFGFVAWATHGLYFEATDVLSTYYRLSQWSDWGTTQWNYPILLTDVAPFLFMASCHNGNIYLPDCYSSEGIPRCAPDFTRTQVDGRISLGYGMLRDVAVATVSATEVSSGLGGTAFVPGFHDQYYGDLLNETFAYLYTNEIVSRFSPAGDALKNIKYTHFNSPVEQYNTYHEQLIFNLYGDPSLKFLRPEICDFNGDKAVGPEDIKVFTQNFGSAGCQVGDDCPGDADDDGDVDAMDLSLLSFLYGDRE